MIETRTYRYLFLHEPIAVIKDHAAASDWRVNPGRRESRLPLVPKIRTAVDTWRDQSYPGVSEVTPRLFEYWFEGDHDVPGFGVPFRYYICQREAMETLAWLVEIAGKRDAGDLIRSYAEVYRTDLFSDNIVFQTTMDGRRQILRYVQDDEGREVNWIIETKGRIWEKRRCR